MNVCEEVYAGEKESSEPESKAIQQFVMSKKSRWLSFISIHSYGALWLHHWEKNHPSLTKNTFVKIVISLSYEIWSKCKSYYIFV